jgi:hypothetical protein
MRLIHLFNREGGSTPLIARSVKVAGAEREGVGISSNLPDRAEAQRISERGNAPWGDTV